MEQSLHSSLSNKHSAGFTLIELLITTSLTVLLMLTITTMFMTFLIGNSKTNVKKTVKEEGLHAMSQIEFILKNAFYVDESTITCGSGMPSIQIVSLDGGLTEFRTISDSGVNKIASNSATLTSDAVILENLRFDCSGEVGNRKINVSFTLRKNAPTLSNDDVISEEFTSTVNIRN